MFALVFNTIWTAFVTDYHVVTAAMYAYVSWLSHISSDTDFFPLLFSHASE